MNKQLPPANPSTSASQRAVFEHLLLVITFLLIFIMAARTPLDTDMWWHLSAGEEMLRSGKILMTDVFSYTRAGALWTNPYWLSQIGMAALFRWQGFLGLGAAVALLATASMGLVYLQCSGPGLLKAVALLLGSIVASVVWSPRPQLVSLLLLALTAYLIYLYKWKGKDILWGLPLVFFLWGNFHGGYPLGLILIGAALAGEVLNHILALGGETVLPWRKIIRLAVWGILGGLAVLANPNGLRMWLLPFQTVDMRVLQEFIPEWASPDFHNLLQQALLWLLLASFTAVGVSGKMIDGSDLFTLLGFAYMAFVARRNFGPFALVAVPILCRYGAAALEAWEIRAPWLRKLAQKGDPEEKGRAIKKMINLGLVGLLGLVALGKLYGVTQPALVNGYLEQSFPAQAVRWLNENQPPGRLLNEYNWGGYLQWALRDYPIFVDGRTDLFNDEMVGEWIEIVQVGPGWQEMLDRYQVDLVMLEPDRPLLIELEKA
ncbi:MAG: hypothetical protein IH586_04245, partial [Anaerolineaceae bacterium]|nr:hypothetical protein [Anaerolineaceae bacterium]